MIWYYLRFLAKLSINKVENYGFKSVKCPLAIQKLTDFGNDLQQTIKKGIIQTNKQQFSRKVKNDIEHIKKGHKISLSADKLRNI